MKITHLIDSGGIYGAEAVVLTLMDAQRNAGRSPALISLGETGDGPKPIEAEAANRGHPCMALRLGGGMAIRDGLDIARTAASVETDLIHSHGYRGDILLGFLPRRVRKLPVVSTLHGLTAKRVFTRVWFYRALGAVALRNLDGVVAVSRATAAQRMLRLCGVRPVVIPNGIPELDFRQGMLSPEARQVIDGCANRIRIVSVGRLSAEKGYDVLVRAIAILASQSVDVGAVIIGEGSERAALTALARECNVGERVHFAGYVAEAYLLVPHFDAFVLSSYTEGVPITLLEAMQAGTPIVASGVGGVPRLLDEGRCGTMVAPGDPHALADAIRETVTDRDRSALRAGEAAKRAVGQFAARRMEAAYFEQYERALLRFG